MFQPHGLQPNLVNNIARPLRYAPEGCDFVIENGGEFFNRPLYGGNTAFRVDAGDMPEFSLYLPGRGGNLRLGLRAADGSAKWLHEAARITARYRPGGMLYEIRDPLLGAGAVLRLHAIALHQTDGLIVRIETAGAPARGAELVAAYGGLDGKRGRRDGDIGTEDVPIGEYFQLKPGACAGNTFALDGPRFILRAPPATIAGLFPAAARLALADAAQWSSPAALLASAGDGTGGTGGGGGDGTGGVDGGASGGGVPALRTPVVIAVMPLAGDGGLGGGGTLGGSPAAAATAAPLFICLQRIQETNTAAAAAAATTAAAVSTELDDYAAVTAAGRPGAKPAPVPIPLAPACAAADLPRVFDEADAHFAAVRAQIAVETPDPFINAAVAALNVGADAVWDEPQGAVMHGAIAWRARLLGWRGPYAMDALGWHDRARRHLAYWAARQNTDPVPEKLPPPDEDANLARSEAALHSNGDISHSHYDMNAVYIDALFRHFLWTGGLDFARGLWPVIERHLAWERRLFRREFGPEKLPLYEAYAQIWASDDLQYHGGGVTHASAYNFLHHAQAARLARLLGENGKAALYENEAALIARAMREFLWMPDKKMFGEFRDCLGLRRLHESPALWTFYHALDAGLATPDEAAGMVRHYAAEYLRRAIPVRGPGVPADEPYAVLPTTDWMPYTWSVNNVVMGENIHAALALWQAGAPEHAFRLMKSALLASMFMGVCPGNVGSLNYLDVYRRESQRDFADGAGVAARAIVEGLFGIRPDALAGELLIAPGFPGKWTRASIRHPDVSCAYERDGAVQKFTIGQHGPRPVPVTLRIPVLGTAATVKCAGTGAGETRTLRARNLPGQYLAIERLSPAKKLEIEITWSGDGIFYPDVDGEGAFGGRDTEVFLQRLLNPPVDWNAPPAADAKFDAVPLAPHFNDRVTQIFKNEYRSPRPPRVSLAIPKQGIGAWAGHVHATAGIDDAGLRAAARAGGGRVTLPNGVFFATPGAPDAPNILFTSLWDNHPGEADVPLAGRARRAYFLMAGSTNWMQSRIDNGEVLVAYADGTRARLALRNPDTWWPIEQDLFYDDYQFRCDTPPPARLNLKTGEFRALDADGFKGKGRVIPGGAATVLHLPLAPEKELRSLTLRTLSNEVIIGLMAVTLER
jgi:hypothetical protein